MNRLLMIAYHYPPVRVSSGIQRTLSYSRYLPSFGWRPIVLTVDPRAYVHKGEDQLRDIPADIVVKRAFALDTARQLSIGGRYPLFMALPDRWSSWWFGGVWAGLRLIRELKPEVIWSTYPIATAHLIGLTLHRLTGLPWVADCRDSMTEETYPTNPRIRKMYLWLERQMMKRASRIVFTTPGTARMYAERYPQVTESRLAVIANGFDEESFQAAEQMLEQEQNPAALNLVHSGVLYPSERDPRPFFGAIAELKHEGHLSSADLRVTLRATGHDADYEPLISEQDIADIVRLKPAIGYQQALSEMIQADGLLMFQAANCNHQIPAKLYEYMRAAKPILGLTDAEGDTALVMREAGIDTIVPLNDQHAIKGSLMSFLDLIRSGEAPVAQADFVAGLSRRSRTEEFANLLDELILPLSESN